MWRKVFLCAHPDEAVVEYEDSEGVTWRHKDVNTQVKLVAVQ